MVQRYCFFFIYMVDEFVHHIVYNTAGLCFHGTGWCRLFLISRPHTRADEVFHLAGTAGTSRNLSTAYPPDIHR